MHRRCLLPLIRLLTRASTYLLKIHSIAEKKESKRKKNCQSSLFFFIKLLKKAALKLIQTKNLHPESSNRIPGPPSGDNESKIQNHCLIYWFPRDLNSGTYALENSILSFTEMNEDFEFQIHRPPKKNQGHGSKIRETPSQFRSVLKLPFLIFIKL